MNPVEKLEALLEELDAILARCKAAMASGGVLP